MIMRSIICSGEDGRTVGTVDGGQWDGGTVDGGQWDPASL